MACGYAVSKRLSARGRNAECVETGWCRRAFSEPPCGKRLPAGNLGPTQGTGPQRQDHWRLRATVVFRERRLSGRQFPAPRRGFSPKPVTWWFVEDRAAGSPVSGIRIGLRRRSLGAGRWIAKGAAPCRTDRSNRLLRRRAFGLSRRRACLRGAHGVGREAYPPGASTFFAASEADNRIWRPIDRATECCRIISGRSDRRTGAEKSNNSPAWLTPNAESARLCGETTNHVTKIPYSCPIIAPVRGYNNHAFGSTGGEAHEVNRIDPFQIGGPACRTAPHPPLKRCKSRARASIEGAHDEPRGNGRAD